MRSQGDEGVGMGREAEPVGRLKHVKRVEIKGKTRNRFGWNKKQDLPEGWSIKDS